MWWMYVWRVYEVAAGWSLADCLQSHLIKCGLDELTWAEKNNEQLYAFIWRMTCNCYDHEDSADYNRKSLSVRSVGITFLVWNNYIEGKKLMKRIHWNDCVHMQLGYCMWWMARAIGGAAGWSALIGCVPAHQTQTWWTTKDWNRYT